MLVHLRQLHALDHLADSGVRCHEHRVTVLLRKIKSQRHHIAVFLHACGGEDYGVIISVTAAARKLPVVALTLRDIAEAGAYTHDIYDNCGDVCRDKVGYALLLEGESGTG